MTIFTMHNMINLAIIDDEILFRKGMVQVIQGVKDMELIQETGKGAELRQQLKGSRKLPKVILMGMKKEHKKGLEEVRLLSTQFPGTRIIMLSSHFSQTLILNLLECGVAACLPRTSTPEEIEASIRQVVEKGFFYNDHVLEVVRGNLTNKQQSSRFKIELSSREKQILQLICEQYTNTEISKKLNISFRTVEWHRTNILQKLKCKNTAGLVAIAILHNLVQIDLSNFQE